MYISPQTYRAFEILDEFTKSDKKKNLKDYSELISCLIDMQEAIDNSNISTSLPKWKSYIGTFINKAILHCNAIYTLLNEIEITYKRKNETIAVYEKEEFHLNSEIVERHWIYDTIKNTQDFKTFTNGSIDYWSRTHYNENSNKILVEFFDTKNASSDIYSTSNDYKYDDYNNWIEKKHFWKGEIQSITYRQIKYYE
jgi:hypothetical protein